MKIAAKGQPKQLQELTELLGETAYETLEISNLNQYDVVFDLDFDDDPENYPYYAAQANLLVVVGAVKLQLEAIVAEFGQKPSCTLIGWNTLPTFINRSLAECTLLNPDDLVKAQALFKNFDAEVKPVSSRVGMVTPRVVCMIINEAYYTVQEGTASREDIDLGMKLGTAYPKGPFEWCKEMGIDHVYETLEAVYEDTKDERYKICSLLKTEYLQSFIN